MHKLKVFSLKINLGYLGRTRILYEYLYEHTYEHLKTRTREINLLHRCKGDPITKPVPKVRSGA